VLNLVQLNALTARDIPGWPARVTVLIQLAEDMLPADLAPLLGLPVITALQWCRRAVTDWTAYHQARQNTIAVGPPKSGR
jgi:hypothetical protein